MTASASIGEKAGWLIGIGLLALLVVKAWIDLDPSWDTWFYHIPYAARMWNITTAAAYEMEPFIESHYVGFPLLQEWLQGLLWTVTGHLQSTNLICVSALTLFVLFLHRRFSVSPGLSVLALLAIPLVQTHAASSYIDLPGNLAVSVFLLLTWQLFQRQQPFHFKETIPFFVSATIAANIKIQLIPVMMVLVLVAVSRVYWVNRHILKITSLRSLLVLRRSVLLALMLLVVFFVPVKNTVLYGNPSYPLQLFFHNKQIYFIHNKGMEKERSEQTVLSWLSSVMEKDRQFGNWSIDQMVVPRHGPGDRWGGYFAFYVYAQLAMLVWQCLQRHAAEKIRPLQFFTLLTLMTSYLPRAYELRYYMYWMLVLVSMNLILAQQTSSVIPRRVMALLAVAAFGTVVYCTGGFYLWPQHITLNNLPVYAKRVSPFSFVPDHIDLSLVNSQPEKSTVCIQGNQPLTYLYTNTFHPPAAYKVIARWSDESCPSLP